MRDEQRLLAEVDAVRARLDAHRPFAPGVERELHAWSTPRFLRCSSGLGAQRALSGTEIAAFLEREIVSGGHALETFLALRRHQQALERVRQHARGSEPLDLDLVREVHGLLVGPAGRPGEWKREPSPPTRRRGREFRFAPPSQVDSLMRRLLEELPRRLAEDHPVKAAAWFYFQFNEIHPFQQDNGKVARLLATALLLRRGYPPLMIRPDDLGEYLDALAAVRATVPPARYAPLAEGVDLGAWLEFLCQGLVRSGERMDEIASGRKLSSSAFSQEVSGAQARMLDLLAESGGWRLQATQQVRELFERVREVVEHLTLRGPLYSIQLDAAELLPTHGVPQALRKGLPSSDAGLVGVIGLAIRGDPLLAKAVQFPPNETLRVGVSATAVALQVALSWNDGATALHHGPRHASEWPDRTLDELLTESLDRQRKRFEERLRELNLSQHPSET